MQVLLISTYDLGRQPFGLASPEAFLRAAGHQVRCVDLTRTRLVDDLVGLLTESASAYAARQGGGAETSGTDSRNRQQKRA